MMKNSFFFFTLAVAVFVWAVPSCFSADQQYEDCLRPLRCGPGPKSMLPIFGYPFWGVDRPSFCGVKEFQLFCKNNQNLTLDLDNVSYRVLSFDLENQTIRVAEESLFTGGCPNLTLNFTGSNHFTLAPPSIPPILLEQEMRFKKNIFTCPGSPLMVVDEPSPFTCEESNRSLLTYYAIGPSDASRNTDCTKVREISANSSAYRYSLWSSRTLEESFKKVGFLLIYKIIEDKTCRECSSSGGLCGSETVSGNFRCFCSDRPYNSTCPFSQGEGKQNPSQIESDSGSNLRVKISIGVVAAVVGLTVLAVILCTVKTFPQREQNNIEALVPLKRYSYAQVKKITKSFTDEVGKGGFGVVYRGILCDGRVVAVKVLKESKGNNGEDFVNEVVSMSRTSHVNIVTLLGFCYEGSKRAILYEFLENGSLDEFISRKKSSKMDNSSALYGIALGVARGLEYLHNGCRARIVHFDIKPQNVLLDNNLCPKVSDFGLARLCENKESILSSMNTRGTIGYIAPEVFSRMYGRVSHKSDVYSYGMLVLEMIGARNKTSNEDSSSNTSSMYFPEWIYKDLEKGESKQLIENGINCEEEEEIAKKMTLVGLWCIQSSPSDRPPMNRVVEMMEGSLDALEVPPRPVFQFSLMPNPESSWISEEI